MCVGNPDTCLVEAWKKNCTSLHNSSGMLKITQVIVFPILYFKIRRAIGYLDTHVPGRWSVQHKKCQSILFNESRAVRCSLCSSCHVKLTIMTSNARTLLRQPVAEKT